MTGGDSGEFADLEVTALFDKLRSRDVGATERQLALVADVLPLYERRGVIRSGAALPLSECCSRCGECWSDVRAEERPPHERSGMAVPWVGPRYFEHRVCVVAINHNCYGGLGANWWVVNGHIKDRLRPHKRTNLPYGIGSYLAAVLANLQGARPDPQPSADACADGWEACAFVEAVKCSPCRYRGQPTEAMWRNCPGLFVSEELSILAPQVIIAVGRGDVAPGLREALSAECVEAPRSAFERYAAVVSGQSVPLLCCNHPSWGWWRKSHPSLVASLSERPLTN
jgi:hypothetical protein